MKVGTYFVFSGRVAGSCELIDPSQRTRFFLLVSVKLFATSFVVVLKELTVLMEVDRSEVVLVTAGSVSDSY
jgi:hypothetical protein